MGVAIPLGSLLVAAVIYLLVKSRKRDNRRNTVVYDTENLQAIQEIGGAGEAPAAKPPNADRHTFNARASQVQRQSIGDMIDHTEDDPELAPPSYNELPESQLSRRR
ncbi:hypothetical protein GQ54DRAFT_310716 [Martensiomyces pterosporus]|nr:hypothetical protein GQ54DRAFT_310716 [Martensiomyces pterosporus]